MARWSQRIGPPTTFELTATPTIIPNLSITRRFDDGELLIFMSVHVDNALAATFERVFDLMIDGVAHPNILASITLPVGFGGGCFNAAIIPIAAGQHTIAIRGTGNAAVGDSLPANFSSLTVIQLPQWDDTQDLPFP